MDPPRILVVDDDPALREMLGEALREAGYVVRLASDGQEAMRQCRAERVALVVTDLFMPKQEGVETIRLLRHEFGKNHLEWVERSCETQDERVSTSFDHHGGGGPTL